MSSVLLLALVGGVIAIPGIPATMITFRSGEAAVVTRLAAIFGLGFTVTAGCAFFLSSFHIFRLPVFVPVWLVICAALWVFALRTSSLSSHLRSALSEISANKLALGIGVVALLVVFLIHLKYMYVLGAPRYVYYLNGIEIANSHGVPASTLEYGQSWPPATDKVYLDSFTGMLVLFSSNMAVGPSVLLMASILGAFVGLWAAAWELGLRWLSVLVPVLCLANTAVLSTSISAGYTDYRAEDFGRAVAFCALALGIVAIRERNWRLVVAAGLVLAAASGSHLIPTVVVVLMLCLAGFAALALSEGRENKEQAVVRLLSVGGVSLVYAVIIRALAGGAFGLEGASNQAGYAAAGTTYDPSAYLYGGTSIARDRTSWGTQPDQVLRAMVTGHILSSSTKMLLLLLLAVGLAVLLLSRPALRAVAVVGLGTIVGLIVVAVAFAVVYHTYIDQTFGIRRLSPYVSIGFALLIVGGAETLLGLLERSAPKVAIAIAAVATVALCAWVLPSTNATSAVRYVGNQRVQLVDWVRSSTPCNARFLINQRTEGTFTALTGRYALLEGMGAFLRTNELPYVVKLMLAAQAFFHEPMADDGFLRQHDISYVVVASGYQELGYEAPIGPPNLRQLSATPFLQLVYSSRSIQVYKVVGTQATPVSALLQGPYLHCIRTPVSY
ncbi:MAG TPA: hypothetical protein VLX31_04245 [Streptosporangiaceae bacterium]|nr:hypothetical protein [Streptosporangiaceae bacterium]